MHIAIQQATEEASAKQREVVHLITELGMNQSETAAQLGISRRAVMRHYHKWLDNVRKYSQD